MKCFGGVIFQIDKLDVAELFYNENRDSIKEAVKSALGSYKNTDWNKVKDDTEVKVTIPECLSCTFKCSNIGLDGKEGEYIYESFFDITIWDIKEFVMDDWTPIEVKLKFPLVGTSKGMFEPQRQETEKMADYLKDLIEEDDKLFREIRQSLKRES